VPIVQISRITNRKGLQENLPQLAGAELGWSIDQRRLFIGNGTLQEGAPVIGNTEILTEFSDILNFQTTYTYKGEAAGYTVQTGVTPGTPVTQSLQSWLDQFATVKDFGAVGDGVTDDTDAINRALYQLFCREINPQIRRSLFFPAGVYLVNETIIIPPYATLYGEGADNSVILLTSGDDSALRAYVARTGDSLQQTGANIGNNGAIDPQYVTISNMGFESADPDVDVFLVEDAANCSFTNVNFVGPLTTGDLTTAVNDVAGVRFASTSALITNTVTFDRCVFSGTTYGINTDYQVQGITVSNSKFDTLYQGVVLGTGTPLNGGPTGFKILHNLFDNIYVQGIQIGSVSLNGTGHNIFYDVGNHFNGVTNPASSIIDIGNDNNVSFGDMFQRADAYAVTYPRINLNNTASIATTNGKEMALGPYVRQSAQKITLVNNSVNQVAFTLSTTESQAFRIWTKTVRGTAYRTGEIVLASAGGSTLTWASEIVENTSPGVSYSFSQVGTTITVYYTTTNTGVDAELSYSVQYFSI
jgi:hypothetical protein